jgi:K+-transporting ATPase KdpF subunit
MNKKIASVVVNFTGDILFKVKSKIAKSVLLLVVVPASSASATSNNSLSYLIGGIIALFIMGYLVYSLIHPEKF